MTKLRTRAAPYSDKSEVKVVESGHSTSGTVEGRSEIPLCPETMTPDR